MKLNMGGIESGVALLIAFRLAFRFSMAYSRAVLREIYIGCTVATASRILGCVWAAVLLAACLTCHLGRIGIRPIKAYRSSVFTLLRTWPHVVITSVAMVLDDHAWPRVGAVLGRGWVMQLLYSSRLPLTALWSQCLLHVRVPRAQWRALVITFVGNVVSQLPGSTVAASTWGLVPTGFHDGISRADDDDPMADVAKEVVLQWPAYSAALFCGLAIAVVVALGPVALQLALFDAADVHPYERMGQLSLTTTAISALYCVLSEFDVMSRTSPFHNWTILAGVGAVAAAGVDFAAVVTVGNTSAVAYAVAFAAAEAAVLLLSCVFSAVGVDTGVSCSPVSLVGSVLVMYGCMSLWQLRRSQDRIPR